MVPSRLLTLLLLIPIGLAGLGASIAWIAFQTRVEALEAADHVYQTSYIDLFFACEDAQSAARRDPSVMVACDRLRSEENAAALRDTEYAKAKARADFLGTIALFTGIPGLILLTIWLSMTATPPRPAFETLPPPAKPE